MTINDKSSLSTMATFLDIIGDRSSTDFDNITDLANYLAEKLLAQGISHPNDLGFLCSGQAGVPLSVQQALDPNMSEAAKLLLSQACAVQIPMIAGVIDAATLALHRQVVSGVSEPAKARHATGGLFLSLRRQETPPKLLSLQRQEALPPQAGAPGQVLLLAHRPPHSQVGTRSACTARSTEPTSCSAHMEQIPPDTTTCSPQATPPPMSWPS